jgi:hypothetical protein
MTIGLRLSQVDRDADGEEFAGQLRQLAELGEALANASAVDDVLAGLADRVCDVLGAAACRICLFDVRGERVEVRSGLGRSPNVMSSGAGRASGGRLGVSIEVPISSNGGTLGVIHATGVQYPAAAGVIATQLARVLLRLSPSQRRAIVMPVAELFEELARGRTRYAVTAEAVRFGCDLDRPYAVVAGSPANPALARAAQGTLQGALVQCREDDVLVALVPLSETDGSTDRLVRLMGALRPDDDAEARFGVSNPCCGAKAFSAGLSEAMQAMEFGFLVGPDTTVGFEQLGAYKYLLQLTLANLERDSTVAAVRRIMLYDEQHSSQLLETLETFLASRRGFTWVARALYVHPNTLRQRLARAEEVAGLDLRETDTLTLAIALKIARLEGRNQTDDLNRMTAGEVNGRSGPSASLSVLSLQRAANGPAIGGAAIPYSGRPHGQAKRRHGRAELVNDGWVTNE